MNITIKHNKSLLLLISLLFFVSCNDTDYNADPNSEVSLSERYGAFYIDTLFALADSIVEKEPVSTISLINTKLSVGNYDGIRAGFIIKFFNYQSYLDSLADVDSVKIQLTSVNTFGPNISDEMFIDMYRYTSVLDVDSINRIDIWRDPTAQNMELIGRIAVNTIDSSKSFVDIPVGIFDQWREDEESGGLFFQMDPIINDGIIEFGSSFLSQAQQPLLIYFTTVPDTINNIPTYVAHSDTINAVISGSIFNSDGLIGGALDTTGNKLIVSSGVVNTALLKFDFNSLSDKALFYSADLILSSDELNEYDNPSSGENLLLQAVESIENGEFNYLPTRKFLLNFGEDKISFSGTQSKSFAIEMLQGIKNNYYQNEWLEITPSSFTREVSVKKFYGVGAPKESAPMIIIKYFNTD